MRYLFAFALAVLLFSSCQKNKAEAPKYIESQLRIENATPWDFSVTQVGVLNSACDTCTGNTAYGIIHTGAQSAYKTVYNIYRYALITVTMNGKEYNLIPVDYVGETRLPSARYTYRISYDNLTDRILLNLIYD